MISFDFRSPDNLTVKEQLELHLNTVIPTGVLVVSAIALVAILLNTKLIKNKQIRNKAVIVALLAEFVFLVFSDTVIFREVSNRYFYRLTPFASYTSDIFGRPFFDFVQIGMNVLLFVPFGIFATALVGVKNWWKVVLVALFFSSGIEYLQYALQRGFCETDDVIHNSVGAALGCGLYWLITWSKHKFVPKFRTFQ